MIDNGQLYWLCYFWQDKAAFDNGARPALIEDFRSDANSTVGQPSFINPTRVFRGENQVQLADDTWVSHTDWLVDREPLKSIPGPDVPESHARTAIMKAIRSFAAKPNKPAGKRVDRRWVNGKRRHPTRTASTEARNVVREFDEDAP